MSNSTPEKERELRHAVIDALQAYYEAVDGSSLSECAALIVSVQRTPDGVTINGSHFSKCDELRDWLAEAGKVSGVDLLDRAAEFPLCATSVALSMSKLNPLIRRLDTSVDMARLLHSLEAIDKKKNSVAEKRKDMAETTGGEA